MCYLELFISDYWEKNTNWKSTIIWRNNWRYIIWRSRRTQLLGAVMIENYLFLFEFPFNFQRHREDGPDFWLGRYNYRKERLRTRSVYISDCSDRYSSSGFESPSLFSVPAKWTLSPVTPVFWKKIFEHVFRMLIY